MLSDVVVCYGVIVDIHVYSGSIRLLVVDMPGILIVKVV